MSELVLPGCRTTPLGGYLTALGLLRVVTRLFDVNATGHWHRQRFVLHSEYSTVDEIVDALHQRFEPECVVSPWNAGSGFAGNGKNTTAEGLLRWVRESTEPRLDKLRSAVVAGDSVVTRGRGLGWGGAGDKLWDDARKVDVLTFCRNEFPDAALAWLDAAVALSPDTGPAFSRLLGTGGNFGRQDLSVTYLGRVRAVLSDNRSRSWLDTVLNGEESAPYLRDAVGQFDPGRAGGIQSSPWEKADDKGFVNPWSFLLTIEGALLFASAVVRRHGAGYQANALPFQVRGSTSGHPTAAAGESALGELWVPEWTEPARLHEIVHLFAEGRVEWNGRPAQTALDFVRAIATLGVDRGIKAFHRYFFADRLGQNPLAVPAGRIMVTERAGVRLLGNLDHWRERLLRADPPALVATTLRALDEAVFTHARTGDSADLANIFAVIGRCHEAVEHSGAMREVVQPLVLEGGPRLAMELQPELKESRELRIALALATARDLPVPNQRRIPTLDGLRPLLTPVTADKRGRAGWSNRPQTLSIRLGLGKALAEAARRRAFNEPENDTNGLPGVRGVTIAFPRGLRLQSDDMHALVSGTVDDFRIADLLLGLLTVDWHGTADLCPPGSRFANPALNLLALFSSAKQVTFDAAEDRRTMLLRPSPSWPAQLLAGNTSDVLTDAARRLWISSGRLVITPVAKAESGRLAARLLLTPPAAELRDALRRSIDLPEKKETVE